MTKARASVPLSQAKTKLSELVRKVAASGEEVVLTVDGQPAARLVPVPSAPRRLTAAEVNTVRALMSGIGRIPRPSEPFDAVELVGEGRR